MTQPQDQPESPPPRPGRGRLKVYLGAAPGVGKTFRMLEEGRRRHDRGTDVVAAFVECHGRRRTDEMLTHLEQLPRLTRAYRGTSFTEFDLDAALARRPAVALVDELAHTNVPGGRNEKRWQDIDELLDAGIEVITTVNVQHLESLNDVVQKITGVPQRETVPDEVVRRAEQIELVDMPPEGLRRRMVHGNVYAPERVDAALANYFRVGNLTALRELALLWLAGRVDEGLRHYRTDHDIDEVWETHERVVVALTGGPEGDTLIRRAARIAARSSGGSLLAVHIARGDGLADVSPEALDAQRRLVESLGGTYHRVVGDEVPAALLGFAREQHATQLVLGTSRRGRLRRTFSGPGIGETTTELSGDIDVHLVTHEKSGYGRRLRGHGEAAGSAEWRGTSPVATQQAEVEAADRTRATVLAEVCHDLRPPLAAARASVESLRREEAMFSAEQRRLLSVVQDSLDDLAQLTDDLVQLSRLQAGSLALNLTPVALADTVPRVLGALGTRPKEVKHGNLDGIPPVLADARLLERALAHLVAHALGRRSPEAPVEVTALVTPAGRVQLRVIDHGGNLGPSDREALFPPLHHLDVRPCDLTLALSRGLVDAMGGTLTAEDTPGGGLTAVVDLRTAR